jgi:hypothetical protein
MSIRTVVFLLLVTSAIQPAGDAAPGIAGNTPSAPQPVISTHPRLLLNTAEKNRLLAKRSANDPTWLALKASADAYATYSVMQYKFATNFNRAPNTIFYDYQGEGWYEAAFPLAFAYQMTGDTKYSNKLIELAREKIRAQSDPANNPPTGFPPIQLDSYYASRNVGAVIAIIFDHCYDQLGATLRTDMVKLMNDYFDDVRVNGYQAQNYSWAADGNYFGGHLYAVGLMGYASFGDNARAQEMIDWARVRFDGTKGSALPASSVPDAWRSQCFEGGIRPAVAFDFNGPANISGAPFKSGFDFQAWSYGSEEYGRMIDYMLTVKSATGEDLITPHIDWFSQILRAEKHALFPNRFAMDPTGDWGGRQGAVISRGLPTRLAFVLAGTADGPGAQSFAYSEIKESTIPGVTVFSAPEWVDFYFGNTTRPSTELVLSPYYTAYGPAGQGQPGNGAIPYFIQRSDWGASATWGSIVMGSQWWDDHQHYEAGHMVLYRGDDYLLVGATDWKGPAGGSGLSGDSAELLESSLHNTLYFDDFGDFQGTDEQRSGGQSYAGIDQVVANVMSDELTYVRSDLSTAYNRAGDVDDTPNRRLESFYRNFLYIRAANIWVVYDQVTAKASTNPKGPYRKHIRWHMPNKPVISGNVVQLDQGQSRLYLHALLPENARLKLVDVNQNPDPCDGAEPGCTPFGQANIDVWRVEVSHTQNPLAVDFLAIMQPGPKTSTAPVDTRIASSDGKMIGAEIVQASGTSNVVLFNAQAGQLPPPILSTSYPFSGPANAAHTLCGLRPDARYTASRTGGVVSVSQSDAGAFRTSSAGVLQFTLAAPQPTQLTLYFPRLVTADSTGTGADRSEYTGIAVANLDTSDATLTLTAYDTTGARIAGSGIVNPATMTLRRGAQLPIVDAQIFGAGLPSRRALGWMKLESTVRKLVGFFLTFNGSLTFLDGADVSSGTVTSFVLPEIEDGGFTQVHVANPDAAAATLTLELIRSDGTLRSPPVTRTVNPSGALAELVAELFPGVAVAASDYLRVTSTRGVVPVEYLGRSGAYAEAVNGQDASASATTLYCPHYVVGGGNYRSTLSVVNRDTSAGTVRFRFLDDDGNQIGSTQTVSIAAGGKIHITDQRFFTDAGASLAQGYLEILSSGPRLSGSVVFGDPERNRFSSALPLIARLQTSAIFSQVASNRTYFTGIALLNPGAADASATIEVLDGNGTVIRSRTQSVRAGRRIAQLLTQYFPDLVGVDISVGYVRVTLDRGVAGFALFGTNNLTDLSQPLALSAVPPQSVPQ